MSGLHLKSDEPESDDDLYGGFHEVATASSRIMASVARVPSSSPGGMGFGTVHQQRGPMSPFGPAPPSFGSPVPRSTVAPTASAKLATASRFDPSSPSGSLLSSSSRLPLTRPALTLEQRLELAEAAVHALLEASAEHCAAGNGSAALALAKQAQKMERTLFEQQQQRNTEQQQGQQLSHLACAASFSVAFALRACRRVSDALAELTRLARRAPTPTAARARGSIARILLEEATDSSGSGASSASSASDTAAGAVKELRMAVDAIGAAGASGVAAGSGIGSASAPALGTSGSLLLCKGRALRALGLARLRAGAVGQAIAALEGAVEADAALASERARLAGASGSSDSNSNSSSSGSGSGSGSGLTDSLSVFALVVAHRAACDWERMRRAFSLLLTVTDPAAVASSAFAVKGANDANSDGGHVEDDDSFASFIFPPVPPANPFLPRSLPSDPSAAAAEAAAADSALAAALAEGWDGLGLERRTQRRLRLALVLAAARIVADALVANAAGAEAVRPTAASIQTGYGWVLKELRAPSLLQPRTHASSFAGSSAAAAVTVGAGFGRVAAELEVSRGAALLRAGAPGLALQAFTVLAEPKGAVSGQTPSAAGAAPSVEKETRARDAAADSRARAGTGTAGAGTAVGAGIGAAANTNLAFLHLIRAGAAPDAETVDGHDITASDNVVSDVPARSKASVQTGNALLFPLAPHLGTPQPLSLLPTRASLASSATTGAPASAARATGSVSARSSAAAAAARARADEVAAALRHADAAIQADHYSSKALAARGCARAAAGDAVGARASFLEAIGVEADCVEALYGLGTVSAQLGIDDEAIGALQKLLFLVPGDARGLWLLGCAFERRGAFPEAKTVLHKLLEVAPGDANVIAKLGSLENASGDDDSAARFFGEALRIDPGHVPSARQLAVLRYKAGRFEDALPLLRMLVRACPSDKAVRTLGRECVRKTGQLFLQAQMGDVFGTDEDGGSRSDDSEDIADADNDRALLAALSSWKLLPRNANSSALQEAEPSAVQKSSAVVTVNVKGGPAADQDDWSVDDIEGMYV